MKTPIEELRETLNTLTNKLQQLKTEVTKNGFAGEAEEIHFFKHTKPQLYAELIYATDHYAVQSNEPVGTPEMLRDYYEQELLYIIRLFRIHAFHYQYYRTGATILDKQYFLRNGQPDDIPILENIVIEPGFSTPLDYLFAKFIAAECMQDYLLEQLGGQIKRPAKTGKQSAQMRWTGESINLVEVAYGIWLTRQLNDGEASMAEIVRWLEEMFNIHIGDAHRRWQEIAQRKSVSATKYLDLMIAEIAQRIDNERHARRKKAAAK